MKIKLLISLCITSAILLGCGGEKISCQNGQIDHIALKKIIDGLPELKKKQFGQSFLLITPEIVGRFNQDEPGFLDKVGKATCEEFDGKSVDDIIAKGEGLWKKDNAKLVESYQKKVDKFRIGWEQSKVGILLKQWCELECNWNGGYGQRKI